MKRKINLWGLALCLVIAMSSCQEKTYLNTDSIPEVDGINVFFADSFQIFTHNHLDDSVQTSSYSAVALGDCMDYPYTGSINMELYTQFSLPSDQFNFTGDQVKIDSVVLVMPYGDVYLDSSQSAAPQKLHVHRLLNTLELAEPYYDYSTVGYDNTLLNDDPNAVYDFSQYKDSVEIWGTKLVPQLRIKLSDAFAKEVEQLDSATRSNTDEFLKWLPGLCVRPASTAHSLAYFNASSIELLVYYQNSTDDSLTTYFPYNYSYNRHFTRIQKQLAPDVKATLDAPNPDGEEWNYMSYAPGLNTRVSIPYIGSLEDYVINDAVLDITVENSTDYPMVQYIFPYKVLNDTSKQIIKDYAYDLNLRGFLMGDLTAISKPSIGSTYHYELRITEELTKSLLAKEDLELELGPLLIQEYGIFKSPLAKRSTKIGGNNRSDEYKMKLKVIYSKK